MFDNVKTQIRCYRMSCIYNSAHKVNCGYCLRQDITFTNEGCMDYWKNKNPKMKKILGGDDID